MSDRFTFQVVREYSVTPEEKARKEIDRLLNQSGRIIQDHAAINISAA